MMDTESSLCSKTGGISAKEVGVEERRALFSSIDVYRGISDALIVFIVEFTVDMMGSVDLDSQVNQFLLDFYAKNSVRIRFQEP